MIKRILYALIGVVAAALMISTASHAVDLDSSTFEDGNGRFVIAAGCGVVFLTCLYLLVASISDARWARVAADLDTTDPVAVPDHRSLVERFAASKADDPAPESLRNRRGPIVVTKPSIPPDEQPASSATTKPGLFGTTSTAPRASSADGLFGRRTPSRTPDTAEPALTAHLDTAVPSTPPAFTPPPESTPPESTPPESTPRASLPPATAPPAPTVGNGPNQSNSIDEQPITLRDYHPADIDRTIDEQNRVAVDSLVASGTLSSDGPLTASDIRTMLFIAVSSEQLRSVLHDARSEEPQSALPPASSEALIPSRDNDSIEAHPDDSLPTWHVVEDPDDDVDDSLPTWHVAEDPEDDVDDSLPTWHVAEDPEDGVDDSLPTWHVVEDPEDAIDDAGRDDEPPSTGYLYATGGN